MSSEDLKLLSDEELVKLLDLTMDKYLKLEKREENLESIKKVSDILALITDQIKLRALISSSIDNTRNN
jgi:hypothetical protein